MVISQLLWVKVKISIVFLQELDIALVDLKLVIIKLVLEVNNKLSPGRVQTLSKHGP